VDTNGNDCAITGEANFTSLEDISAHSGSWELEYVQLEAGQLDGGAKTYIGRNVTIRYVTYNRRFHQQGTPPPGMISFGILDDQRQHIANGQPLERGSVLRFNTPGGLDVVAEAGFAGFPIAIRETFFYDVAEQMGISVSPRQLTGEAVISGLPPVILDPLRHDLHALIRAIRLKSLKFQSITWIDDFEFSIAASVLSLLNLPHSLSVPRYQSTRYRGLKRAVQQIQHCGQDTVTIKELCSAAHVSWRTLDRAFREHFDITAKQYLTNHRLHQVRRQLSVAVPGIRINDIANNWGFFHPGQFAADYRKCFGELPRQTIRRAKRKS